MKDILLPKRICDDVLMDYDALNAEKGLCSSWKGCNTYKLCSSHVKTKFPLPWSF
jgi:hypothetical protein